MKVKEIQDLINFISKSGLNEVNIETGEFKISVKRDASVKKQVVQSTPAAPPANPAPVEATPEQAAPQPAAAGTDNGEPAAGGGNYMEIKSPMIGTFYRSANPESPPFVKVGDKITKGQSVCIIEAMKLFNEIESELSGTIVKILVDNSTPVEYDQPLFVVDPD